MVAQRQRAAGKWGVCGVLGASELNSMALFVAPWSWGPAALHAPTWAFMLLSFTQHLLGRSAAHTTGLLCFTRSPDSCRWACCAACWRQAPAPSAHCFPPCCADTRAAPTAARWQTSSGAA